MIKGIQNLIYKYYTHKHDDECALFQDLPLLWFYLKNGDNYKLDTTYQENSCLW